MGIFDGYGYGDTDQGGLIDRLMAQLGVQGQYQPSPGFAPNPMNANATMPAQANAPIAVGDYQMPRIGSGFPGLPAHDPATGETVAAQPAPQAMQAPHTMPAALQPYQPEGGFGGAMRGMAANVQAGPIGMLFGGIGGAMGMGRGTPDQQQQHVAMQNYRALVPILGEQKAIIATLNPTIGQEMVKQAIAGKQYAFTTLPDGTVLRQDAHAGTAEPVYRGSTKPEFGIVREDDGKKVYGWKDPSQRGAPNAGVTEYKPAGSDDERGTVTGPDGKPIQIPTGVDRNTFVKEISKINADAAGGKKTEVQAKDEKFANKMELAEKNLKGIEVEGSSYMGRAAEGAPLVGNTAATNWLKSDKYQRYQQARDNFITALLRDESGAAIGTSEFIRYEKELFPQPGDGPGVIAQKREARRIAIEGMKKGAGPGYKSPTSATAGEAPADPLGIR